LVLFWRLSRETGGKQKKSTETQKKISWTIYINGPTWAEAPKNLTISFRPLKGTAIQTPPLQGEAGRGLCYPGEVRRGLYYPGEAGRGHPQSGPDQAKPKFSIYNDINTTLFSVW